MNIQKASLDPSSKAKWLSDLTSVRKRRSNQHMRPAGKKLCVDAVKHGLSMEEVAAACLIHKETLRKWVQEDQYATLMRAEGSGVNPSDSVRVMKIQDTSEIKGPIFKLSFQLKDWLLVFERLAA
jgi:hypothetical protein